MHEALVMVGTDFSEGARAALLHARQLASQIGGEMHVVHVFDPPDAATGEFNEDARRWLHDCDISHRSLTLRRGMAWLELTREARSCEAAVIVIGRHGRSGYQPIELGSTAARIGLAAHCPVMLVGERVPGRAQPRFWRSAPMVHSLSSHSTTQRVDR